MFCSTPGQGMKPGPGCVATPGTGSHTRDYGKGGPGASTPRSRKGIRAMVATGLQRGHQQRRHRPVPVHGNRPRVSRGADRPRRRGSHLVRHQRGPRAAVRRRPHIQAAQPRYDVKAQFTYTAATGFEQVSWVTLSGVTQLPETTGLLGLRMQGAAIKAYTTPEGEGGAYLDAELMAEFGSILQMQIFAV